MIRPAAVDCFAEKINKRFKLVLLKPILQSPCFPTRYAWMLRFSDAALRELVKLSPNLPAGFRRGPVLTGYRGAATKS